MGMQRLKTTNNKNRIGFVATSFVFVGFSPTHALDPFS